ncbi:MAG: hypothetical protein V3V78_05420 [Candidatus Woesearchaeota archaeon]
MRFYNKKGCHRVARKGDVLEIARFMPTYGFESMGDDTIQVYGIVDTGKTAWLPYHSRVEMEGVEYIVTDSMISPKTGESLRFGVECLVDNEGNLVSVNGLTDKRLTVLEVPKEPKKSLKERILECIPSLF